MLLKLSKLSCFRFCQQKLSYERFKGAETIFDTIYNHNNHLESNIKEIKLMSESQRINTLLRNKNEHRQLLSDRIASEFQKLNISPEVKKELIGMFDPTQGIPLTSDMISDQSRFVQGMNKDSRYPLNPNSAVMKIVLRMMYHFNCNKYINKDQSLDVVYTIGTPGFGKSSCFYIAKMIQDIRVKHIVKYGCPPDTIFSSNCKVFYFLSNIKTVDIMDRMVRQIENDFGQVPEIIKKIQIIGSNYQQLINAVTDIYYAKNIKKINVIVDQVNNLYNMDQKSRKPHVSNWVTLAPSAKPMFMVSSKNNAFFQQTVDPILSISKGTNDQHYKKVNIDEQLSVQARLLYAVECLLFQIQKVGLLRSQAIKLIENIKQVPILTHLAIRESIKNSSGFFKNFQSDNSIAPQAVPQLQKALNQNLDLGKLKDSVIKLKEKTTTEVSSETKANINHSLTMLGYILNFSSDTVSEKQMSVNVKLKDENSEEKSIKYTIKTASRNCSQKNGASISNLADTNYFFKSYCLIQKQQDQSKAQSELKLQTTQKLSNQLDQHKYEANLSIFLSMPLRKYEQIRQFAVKHVNLEMFAKIDKLYPNAYQVFKQLPKGKIFQHLICHTFKMQEENAKQGGILEIIIRRENQNIICNCNNLPNFQINMNKSEDLVISYTQKIPPRLLAQNFCDEKNQGTYVRAVDGNQCFDFIIVVNKSSVLKIFLVDVTIGLKKSVQNKKNNFFATLLQNKNFRTFISQLSKQKNIKTIEICYYVLQPTVNYCSKKLKMIKKEKQRWKNMTPQQRQKLSQLKIQNEPRRPFEQPDQNEIEGQDNKNQPNKSQNQKSKNKKKISQQQINERIQSFKSLSSKIKVIEADHGHYNSHFQVSMKNQIGQNINIYDPMNYVNSLVEIYGYQQKQNQK